MDIREELAASATQWWLHWPQRSFKKYQYKLDLVTRPQLKIFLFS